MEDLVKWKGDPRWDDEHSENQFIYPLRIKPSVATKEGLRLAIGNPPEETYRRGPFVCVTSPESHISTFKWAVDFLVPDGTPVLAAYAGEVVEVQEHSNEWGDDPEYRDLLNYMTILHRNGERTQYCHLAQNSVSESGIKIGNRVKQGQQIAIVGKTGWTDRDHLHFLAFRTGVYIGPFTFKSLQPQFHLKQKWWPW